MVAPRLQRWLLQVQNTNLDSHPDSPVYTPHLYLLRSTSPEESLVELSRPYLGTVMLQDASIFKGDN